MSQILNGRRVTATYDAEALRIDRSGRRTDIPLAAVREVRTPAERVVEVVLTDGVVHRVEGGNPTATSAFATALSGLLPQRRDPAGSALVTTSGSRETSVWWFFGPLILLVLAYLGYAGWVASTQGVRVLGVIVGLLPLFIGLLLFFGGLEETSRRITLARRGITVEAYATSRRRGSTYYRYTDADGREHFYNCQRNVQRTHIVYDPRNPGTAAHVQWPPFLLLKLFTMIVPGGLVLVVGVVMVFGALW
ncbi:hypothetical protein RKD23_003673 [Streptomyces sp. SAI-170]|uniref:hypothetical protein n=1 Tax=Streptomyces sp. SAI-170 TaxID=3377729 RepID=UPI003C7E3B14